MKFIYSLARLPKNKKVVKEVNKATERLFNKLNKLDTDSLLISDYTKKYLAGYLQDLQNRLMDLSYILAWAVSSTNLPLNKITLIDHGGGSGVLSLLAKELKIGKVIYNDIYDISSQDAETLGQLTNNKADHYISGNIEELIEFLKTNSLSCDVLVSNDVIEHIYNVDEFFQKVKFVSTGPLSLIMASGANSINSRIRKKIIKDQIALETQDRKKEWGHKPTDCLRAYSKVRRQIISQQNYKLEQEEVEKLAKATRGMIESDIKKSVDNYLKDKKLPPELNHPTNTCDPYTGNWAEHLMDFKHLKQSLLKQGFNVKIMSGYYGYRQNLIKKYITKILNIFISIFKNQGLKLAPFYIIYARKK